MQLLPASVVFVIRLGIGQLEEAIDRMVHRLGDDGAIRGEEEGLVDSVGVGGEQVAEVNATLPQSELPT